MELRPRKERLATPYKVGKPKKTTEIGLGLGESSKAKKLRKKSEAGPGPDESLTLEGKPVTLLSLDESLRPIKRPLKDKVNPSLKAVLSKWEGYKRSIRCRNSLQTYIRSERTFSVYLEEFLIETLCHSDELSKQQKLEVKDPDERKNALIDYLHTVGLYRRFLGRDRIAIPNLAFEYFRAFFGGIHYNTIMEELGKRHMREYISQVFSFMHFDPLKLSYYSHIAKFVDNDRDIRHISREQLENLNKGFKDILSNIRDEQRQRVTQNVELILGRIWELVFGAFEDEALEDQNQTILEERREKLIRIFGAKTKEKYSRSFLDRFCGRDDCLSFCEEAQILFQFLTTFQNLRQLRYTVHKFNKTRSLRDLKERAQGPTGPENPMTASIHGPESEDNIEDVEMTISDDADIGSTPPIKSPENKTESTQNAYNNKTKPVFEVPDGQKDDIERIASDIEDVEMTISDDADIGSTSPIKSPENKAQSTQNAYNNKTKPVFEVPDGQKDDIERIANDDETAQRELLGEVLKIVFRLSLINVQPDSKIKNDHFDATSKDVLRRLHRLIKNHEVQFDDKIAWRDRDQYEPYIKKLPEPEALETLRGRLSLACNYAAVLLSTGVLDATDLSELKGIRQELGRLENRIDPPILRLIRNPEFFSSIFEDSNET